MRYKLLTLLAVLCCTSATAATIGTRQITFVNNCAQPVWFGFSGGSAAGKLTGTDCQTNSDCYNGAQCIQTGAIKQCFWVNPAPANNNYQLAANGGTNTVAIPVLDDALPIAWSGAVAGRTACTGAGCQTADCGNGTGACLASQGFAQPATQAEFTFSKTGTDFYDIEIINGVNIPVAMAANLTTQQQAQFANQPYTCGSPGAATASNPLLGNCNWNFAPPSNDYRWVTTGGAACSLDSDCKNSTCGLSFVPGKGFQKACGSLLGYWTADQVCGVQSNYGAPFYCSQGLPAPQANLTLWNLYSCTASLNSCYQNNVDSTCCGCVNWDSTGLKVPSAPYTQQCTSQNPSWVNSVLPTLSWLKKACPTAYTYPFDDMSSTFTCSLPNNGLNAASYTITFCPVAATPAQLFSYSLVLGYPFLPVTINGQQSCPAASSSNPVCSITNQTAGSTMTVKGSSNHLCSLAVQGNGSVLVNPSSVGCNINTSPASGSNPGLIQMPAGF